MDKNINNMMNLENCKNIADVDFQKNQEDEILSMIADTSKLIAQEKANNLGNSYLAFTQSSQLTNEVEFWQWLSRNYPNNMVDAQMIQETAISKSKWFSNVIQGKGYEWDYMVSQRMNPQKIFSVFEAGDCPTQPGVDIIESGLLDGNTITSYQNKAYVSSNAPDLTHASKDAIVVTNKEKVLYANKKGYVTEQYMDADEIAKVRDSRIDDALNGKAQTNYSLKNVTSASAKAGFMGAVIGMTTETIVSYRAWKSGMLSNEQYIKEVLKAGGDAGITAGATTAVMIPIQATITALGASQLLTIPISIVLGSAINSVVAPCFGRGKYRQILQEARYYQSMENVYYDFINVAKNSAKQYMMYIQNIQLQQDKYRQMKQISQTMNEDFKKLLESI